MVQRDSLVGAWQNPSTISQDQAAESILDQPSEILDITDFSDSTAEQVLVPVLVELQAQKTPAALAVSHGDKKLSYQELVQHSTALAKQLQTLGVTTDTIVGICLRRSTTFLVAALAIMKAGGAYLPLDPSNPRERLSYQLKDAGINIVIAEESSRELVGSETKHLLITDGSGKIFHGEAASALETKIKPDDLAYLIYTSGSTGKPKGVEITHKGLLNLVLWHQKAFQVTQSDRASHIACVAFDAAVWEVWPYLTAGASVHVADDDVVRESETLKNWLVSEKITIGFTPTPITERLLTLDWPSETALRIMLTGGDTLHSYASPKSPFQLINNYGPTECTVLATSGLVAVNSQDKSLPPVGFPIENAQIYIVDEHMQQVPAGTEGEILIGGVGVARGYRNLPEQTMEKFIPDPFDPTRKTKLYRTGDRGRYLPDGQIAFCGRIDEQIKVRGVRIEPTEIERVLNDHPSIKESAVAVREVSSGDKRLIAYLVLSSETPPKVAELQKHLSNRLSERMLPSQFVVVVSLPLNSNGKVDRKNLPEPNENNLLPVELGPGPQNPIEEKLVAIFSSLLKLPRINVQDDFFRLGGHSLLVTQLLARVYESFGVTISLGYFFGSPTVEALAAEIERLTRLKSGSSAALHTETKYSSLVSVQTAGARPPLFCVHSHTGDVLYCGYITQGAGPNQPIYGLQSQAVTREAPHFSVEDMARHYITEIQRVQPVGPYHLFGFCFGGMIAFEMARQLDSMGEEVAFLGVYNSPAPGTLKGWPLGQFSYLTRRTRDELARLRTLKPGERLSHITRNFRNLAIMVQRTVKIDGWAKLRSYSNGSSANGNGKTTLNLEEINIAAAKRFFPAYVFPGKIMLFISPEVAKVYPIAPEVGWRKFASRGLEVIDVPLDEKGWRGAPFVKTVGGRLQEFIS